MTLDILIKELNSELSQDCQIPFQVTKKSLMRTIRLAKKWFYKNYIYAVEECYILVPNQDINNKIVILPDNIIAVNDVNKVSGGMGIMSGDFSFDKMTARSMWNGGSMTGNIDMYVSNRVTYEHIRTMLTHKVTYDYNHLTHRFIILGQIPRTSLVLTVNKAIEDQFLYDDETFFRYILAKAKINLGRILGTISMSYIGNAEIDFDSIKSEGKEELEEIITEIKEDNAPDWFLVQ